MTPFEEIVKRLNNRVVLAQEIILDALRDNAVSTDPLTPEDITFALMALCAQYARVTKMPADTLLPILNELYDQAELFEP
jgi:hypothetical protein